MIINNLLTINPYSRKSGSQRGSGLRRIVCLVALLVISFEGARADVEINETNFPDPNFQDWLRQQEYGSDGYITDDEITWVETIEIPYNSGIASLQGIEFFTALTELDCSGNLLTSLNLSHNTELTSLSCGSNQLTSLDVSHNTKLTSLYCHINQLTSLDLSKNTKLTSLNCDRNKLTELDVSQNKDLNHLTCYGNQIQGMAMTALVNSLPETGGNLYVYDSNGNEGNSMTFVQVAAANSKGWTPKMRDDNWVDYPGVPIAINATNFPDPNFLSYVLSDCDTDKDTYLSDEEIAVVKSINVNSKSIASLQGIENFTSLTSLCCMNNELTALNVSNNTVLTTLECDNNQLTTLDVSKNSALIKLSCMENRLTALNVSNNTALTHLSCSSNQLTALDVSKNTGLNTLRCFINKLADLDMTNNTALEVLNCNSNQLTNLDLSKNTVLAMLDCSNNQLTTLDVSNNTKLFVLDCSNNQLTTLDVSNMLEQPYMTRLYCDNNQIRESAMTALVNSLPTINANSGNLRIYNTDGSDGNVITTAQVKAAKAKGWAVKSNDGNDYSGIAISIAIDENSFPDEKFRSYVLSNYDLNKDKILDDEEIEAVTEIDVSGQGIADLRGIRYFTALKHLDCHDNQLIELDTWRCEVLEWIDCSQNQLLYLNIYECPALTYVNCQNNQLKVNAMGYLVEALPSSGGTLYVYNADSSDGNKMTTEQVQAATEKGWTPMMNDGGNYVGVEPGIDIDEENFRDENFRAWLKRQPYGKDEYITNVELAGITEMDVSGQGIKELNLSFFTELKTLKCNDNEISYLWLNNNPAITELWCYNNHIWGYCVVSLLGSLPNNNGVIRFASDSETEDNAMTTTQVTRAANKGWQVLTADGADYEGIDPGLPIINRYFYDDELRNVVLRGYDSDVDGYLNSVEIKHTTTLDISNRPRRITNLLGVERFTSMTELICWGNQLRSLPDRYLPPTTGGVIRFYKNEWDDGNSLFPSQVQYVENLGWRVLMWDGSDWVDYPGVIVLGDANGNAEVDAWDIATLRDYILGLNPRPFSFKSANLNGDGVVDIVDLTMLIEMLK